RLTSTSTSQRVRFSFLCSFFPSRQTPQRMCAPCVRRRQSSRLCPITDRWFERRLAGGACDLRPGSTNKPRDEDREGLTGADDREAGSSGRTHHSVLEQPRDR